ncbi:ATP-binding protein [uncultured Victivallis sp.]|uniref:ATP-binding protein n=1 Tax=uncultured Victivallis sp. TaxID=354118 RepID=UPI0025E0E925|nr:ATP-binding protein [uncultured Victivallis sp.]
MNIVKGKQIKPLKCVMYGPEGIGKTTFASRWPRPLFLDFEGGTGRLNVDRVPVASYPELEQVMAHIAQDHADYRTLVFDTADWLDRQITRAVCDAAGKKGIEEFGYGKGFTFLAEKWAAFLDRLNRFGESTGLHLVFLAHATLRKFEQPDESGAYDRWELKCAKPVCPLLKEWADMLLFANYKTIVVNDNGKSKVSGGKRVIYTTHHPCWDAKNRFGFPDELAFDPAALAPELVTVIRENSQEKAETTKPAVVQVQTPPPPPVPVEKPAPAAAAVENPEKAEALRQVKTLMEMSGVSPEQLSAEVARCGVCPAGTPIEQYNLPTLKRIAAGWEVIKNNIKKQEQ